MDLSLGIILLLIAIIVMLFWQNKKSDQDATVGYLKSDINELSKIVNQFHQTVGDKIDRNNQSIQSSVQKQLSESAKLITDVTQRLTKLDDTNRQVVDVANELKTLQNVLQNPKQRGVLGEYYLKTVLDNIIPANNYQMQYRFKNGDTVDAVLFLDRGQILPIDSKFSLENYNRMVETVDKTERDKLLMKVKSDLKGRIDETSKYIRPTEGTMDFAFMFIPSEALYYDLLIGGVGAGSSARDLIEYAFRDKKVIIVSPTSFMAYLQTVLQGLRSLKIEEQAKEIQARVSKLGQHIGKFDEYMGKLGKSLGQTVGHFNNAHKELAKVDKDVVKIAGSDSNVDTLEIDRPRLDE